MIIYLFNSTEYTTINLPVTVSGMYPLYIKDRLIANIISTNDKWKIQLSNDMISDDFSNNNFDIIPYKICVIKTSYNEDPFTFVATPKYDNTTQVYDINNAITVGNVDNCDITYKALAASSANGDILKLTVANPGLVVETNSTRFFASGQRLATGMRVRSGDYIFFYGLKIIFVGNRLIVNNPNGQAKVNTTNLTAREKDVDYNVVIDPNKPQNDEPLFKKEEYFYKSPRFNFTVEEKQVDIEMPPKPLEADEMPVLLTIGPQLTMMSTSIVTLITYIGSFMAGESTPLRFALSMMTMVVTLAGTLLWPNITKKYTQKKAKQKEEKQKENYKKYLTQKKQEIDSIKINQKETIVSNHPSIEQCISIIENKTKELWQRNINHDDFLAVRLGLGVVPSKIKIQQPQESYATEEEDELLVVAKTLIEEAKNINDVPIAYNFTKQSINAIVGNNILIKKVMDSVFLQLLTFHSYTDLKIIVFTKEPNKWEYLKVAPHCWDNPKTIRYFATSVEELSVISADLEKTFDARVSNDDEVKKEDDGSGAGQQDYKDFKPYYLFFIDDMTSVRNISLINKVLRYKKNMGFSIISTSQSISTLPSETSDFIVVSENDSAIMTNEINHNNQQIFKVDNIPDNLNMYRCTQKLANIPILVEKAKYELPASISFLELYGLGRVEQLNSLARWSDNNPFLSLAVPIGIDQSGEIFKMDIHEKAYGPHGLVAGTTGSGKSEWIVTYILSLAVNFNPDEVQFVLIDYKGGGLAKSFENEEMGVKLPHLAGTITNLDKSEIFRSIAAIESELKRRQSMFNDAREKLKEGSMNIYKYQQYYRKGLIEKPLSHLLIICDEFAELKQQQPEFMDQLISTSRIGRSLGVHLILATQKPSGVVNEQIWSNSKFKVCLKVQDKGDSNEILKKPDAAFLKQTGAFYLQVGNDDYYNLGQVAWAGAKYYPSDKIKRKIDESIQYIDNIGRTVGIYEEQQESETKVSQGEELLNIVSYISELSKQITLKGVPLWLENVPAKIILSDLFKKYGKPQVERYNYLTPIGEYDEPRKQEQGLLNINLADGNVAIIGQGESGIDSLISTIMWSSICDHTPAEIAYYVIDYGAETLKKFAKFPQVGEVVLQDDPDKITGVLELVMEELEKRKEILSDYNGSFEYYNKVSEQKMHLIVMVINSYDIFIEAFPKLDDIFSTLFRDAPKCGVVFVASVNSPNGLRARQLQNFNHTIVMQLADDSQYRGITNCRRGLMPKKLPGRGICKLDATDADSYCEFQTAMIAEEEKELEIIKAYADKCMNYYKTKVKQLAKIPDDVTSEDLIKYVTTLAEVPIGVNFYEKDIAKFDFLSHKINLITSKQLKANLPFIYGLTTVLSKTPGVKVRLVDMLNIFEKPILDIKLFNDDIETVIAAIEKDVLTRTDTQDYGVNIILGAGQFKKALSAAGMDILKNLFANVPNSKKCIFILLDDYDKLRTLKLESWFEQVDVSSGIWLDQGYGNQSLFTIKEVSTEDKKYDYEGLAVTIKDSEYTVIKTMMDGDE